LATVRRAELMKNMSVRTEDQAAPMSAKTAQTTQSNNCTNHL